MYFVIITSFAVHYHLIEWGHNDTQKGVRCPYHVKFDIIHEVDDYSENDGNLVRKNRF